MPTYTRTEFVGYASSQYGMMVGCQALPYNRKLPTTRCCNKCKNASPAGGGGQYIIMLTEFLSALRYSMSQLHAVHLGRPASTTQHTLRFVGLINTKHVDVALKVASILVQLLVSLDSMRVSRNMLRESDNRNKNMASQPSHTSQFSADVLKHVDGQPHKATTTAERGMGHLE